MLSWHHANFSVRGHASEHLFFSPRAHLARCLRTGAVSLALYCSERLLVLHQGGKKKVIPLHFVLLLGCNVVLVLGTALLGCWFTAFQAPDASWLVSLPLLYAPVLGFSYHWQQWRSSDEILGGAHRKHNFLMISWGRTSIANLCQIYTMIDDRTSYLKRIVH